MIHISCSSEFKNIGVALLQVQSKVSGVARDAKADAGRRTYKYATLEAVIDAVRPACVEAGIVLLQAPHLDAPGGVVSVETVLVHAASGEYMSCTSACSVNAGDAQAIGSAQTYMRRYGLMSLLGLAPEDDDGQAARGAPTGQTQPPRQPVVVSRDKIVAKLLSMYEALGMQPKSLDGLDEAALIAEGTKLRNLMEGVKK
jgi:hypothetical protein